ncbi:MAG: hypothetical protein P4N59_04250 [Negativicutes bacterium]|nr:hypothetical protein [Negativicutes bacterium]
MSIRSFVSLLGGLGFVRSALLAVFAVVLGYCGGWLFFSTVKMTEAKAILVYPPLQHETEAEAERALGPTFAADYVQLPDFAREVAKVVGDSTLGARLPARIYGGRGLIASRVGGSGNTLEVRVSADTQGEAVVLAQAIADTIVKQEETSVRPQIASLKASRDRITSSTVVLRDLTPYLVSKLKVLVDKMIEGANDSDTAPNVSSLLDHVVKADYTLENELFQIDRKIATISRTVPKIFAVTPLRGVIETPLSAGLLGALAGLAIFLGCFAFFGRRVIRRPV